MKTHTNKAVAKKIQTVANSLPKMQSSGASTFIDNKSNETQLKENIGEVEPQEEKFEPIQEKSTDTGLPDNLKSGVEKLSGHSMDDVKVNDNPTQPANLNALAYAQGANIHVTPEQEIHLPHETWHVVQQKQGTVQPTMQIKEGVPVNDDARLENEADIMGAKATGL